MAADAEAEPRYIPPGSCTWCGHPPHTDAFPKTIRAGKNTTSPCPCARPRWENERTNP